MNRATTLLAALSLTAACYHATVETGATPSGETFTKDWASSWIYGLVPPSVVETARRCPNGVARVETQLTFVNQLVSLITLGIYTPMSIRATCASRPSTESKPMVRQGDALPTAELVVEEAARLSRQLGRAVWIEFE